MGRRRQISNDLRFLVSTVLIIWAWTGIAPAAVADISKDSAGNEITASDKSVVERGQKRKETTGQHARLRRKTGIDSSDSLVSGSKSRSSRQSAPVSVVAQADNSEAERAVEQKVSQYVERLNTWNVCLQTVDVERCNFPDPPVIPTAVAFTTASDQPQAGGDPAGPPPPVVLTPRQVAYVAFARLRLAPATPGIGPPPSSNQWKMAAVGYPLWLWGKGNLNPTPVSDSVGGLYVSLKAHVAKIVFTMGDGTTVTCTGTGTPWGPWVKPGTTSPTCGHTYTTPSLPQGNYTVTATTHWSVAWNVTGTTGVIPFVQSASTTLPVGELQVLVR